VVGAIGATPKRLEKNPKGAGTTTNISYFRKMHSWEQHEYSLRKVLDIAECNEDGER